MEKLLDSKALEKENASDILFSPVLWARTRRREPACLFPCLRLSFPCEARGGLLLNQGEIPSLKVGKKSNNLKRTLDTRYG